VPLTKKKYHHIVRFTKKEAARTEWTQRMEDKIDKEGKNRLGIGYEAGGRYHEKSDRLSCPTTDQRREIYCAQVGDF
jgi:hypothetical protein